VVNTQSYMKSIFYLLIRGRQGVDKSDQSLSFIKIIVSLINFSEKWLQRHQTEEKSLKASYEESKKEQDSELLTLSQSVYTSSILHNYILNLSISCLLDIYYFIAVYAKQNPHALPP
jgi:hypothetical protein